NRTKVVVAKSVHPQYVETLRTYVQNLGIEVVQVPWTSDGRVGIAALREACTSDVFAVAVQSPNFLGVLEDYDAVVGVAGGAGAQPIRRAKATSNICTNEALIALGANMYLSMMGKAGLREVAQQCLQKAAYLRKKLSSIASVSLPFGGPIYNELVVRTMYPA